MIKKLLVALVVVRACCGYSVLSHEAVVDALWAVSLRPLLLARYPQATREELRTAHGYAYGGAIIQDLGFYPHGAQRFSDLTHYVRTGDFIVSLLKQSRDLNQYAFALGALSHYFSDLDGHRYATNIAEPLLYPHLEKKFGKFITYEDNPLAHLQTEFGFDVLEVARGQFAPQAYHDFIGFFVATDVLQRAFQETYGLDLSDLFDNFDVAVESFRRAVSKTIPTATRIAWVMRQDEIRKAEPSMTRRRFIYTMSRASYEKNWGKQYERPSMLERMLAFLFKLIPPIGPLKALRFKMPTPPVEHLFMESFNRTIAQYHGELDEVNKQTLKLEDKNYDVGVITAAGAYKLNDDTQAFWLNELAQKHFATLDEPMRRELLNYYKDLKAPINTKKKKKEWRRLLAQLDELKTQNSSLSPN